MFFGLGIFILFSTQFLGCLSILSIRTHLKSAMTYLLLIWLIFRRLRSLLLGIGPWQGFTFLSGLKFFVYLWLSIIWVIAIRNISITAISPILEFYLNSFHLLLKLVYTALIIYLNWIKTFSIYITHYILCIGLHPDVLNLLLSSFKLWFLGVVLDNMPNFIALNIF